ncbi:MAG: AAA family ATPase, partial [Clostridiales bacterium]|nr:AAA family ATPase [Clostridiales bacterium]
LNFDMCGEWDSTNGLTMYFGNTKYTSVPKDKNVEAALEYLRFAKGKYFVLFFNPKPNDLEQLRLIENHCIVFVGENLPEFKKAVNIRLPAPSYEEYEREFKNVLKPKKSKALVQQCAQYSQGMLLSEARNCFKYCVHTKTEFLENRHKFVSSKIIEFVNTSYTFKDLGGFSNFKNWFKKRALLYKKEAKDYGLRFERGVILAGVAGGGKSLAGKTLANEAGLPLIRLDLAKVYDQHVGESERNLRDALESVERVAPAILWIEELGRFVVGKNSHGDSGTTSRLLAILLTWLQEHDKDIFTVATVNDFQNLPKELIRKGRFSEVFGVSYPDFDSRHEIWRIHLEKRGIILSNHALEVLARDSDAMTGAEIEAAVEETLIDCYVRGISKSSIASKHFEEVLNNMELEDGLNQELLDQIEKMRKV